MDSGKKQKLSGTDVRISCDRTKICITVSGDVRAKDAIKLIKECIPDFNNKFFLQTDITSIPDGYSVNIHGRQSVKDYLAVKQTVSCIDIFSVCKIVKGIINEYGKNVFIDTLFDYNAVFVDNDNVKLLNFVFVPFLHSDKKHMSFKEFIQILFIHMTENDAESEENVIRLLNIINEWENSDYGDEVFQKFVVCIDSFFERYNKNSKKDLFTKGTNVIKQLVGNIYVEKRDIKESMLYISFLCDKPKKQYSFAYDEVKKVFWRMGKNKYFDESIFSCIKIGRDKDWADLHIADMTVSGRFGTVHYSENKFYIKYESGTRAVYDTASLGKKDYDIKDGQIILIGKLRYTVKISKQAG